MSRRIVIMAGGTGGHVFPALAVAETLRERGWQVSWLGTHKGLEARVVADNGIAIDWLSVAGLRGKGLFGKIGGSFKLIKACGEAWQILRQRKPDVVLGMGGFVAGPGGLMAHLLGIPLVIHEQNRVPGTTNRWLARRASKVLQAFPDSFKAPIAALCTGNPLRKAFVAGNERSYWSAGCDRALRILIVGGSQGAKVLNETAPAALAGFDGIEVRHQSGTVMQADVQQDYAVRRVNAQVAAFIDDMPAAYRWADLVICRAGAMTISEVAASGVAAIFVPLQHAIDDHQTANARFLSDAGAAVLLPQSQLNPQNLQNRVSDLLDKLETVSRRAAALARLDATQRVADVCAEVAA